MEGDRICQFRIMQKQPDIVFEEVIDHSFSGTDDRWKMPVLATRDTRIMEGDRICQFRIMQKQPDIVFEEVDSLDDVNRGGFGSTGTR